MRSDCVVQTVKLLSFPEFNHEKHVVDPFDLPAGEWKRFYSLDWGYSKPFSLGKWAVNTEGRMVRYGELYGNMPDAPNKGVCISAEDIAQRAWNDAALEGVTECIADPAVWNTVNGHSVAKKFKSAGFKMIPGNNDRILGCTMFRNLLVDTAKDGFPMLLVFNTCRDFIRVIPTLTPSPHHPEDVDTRLEDHVYDDTRYAVTSVFARPPAAIPGVSTC